MYNNYILMHQVVIFKLILHGLILAFKHQIKRNLYVYLALYNKIVCKLT